MCAYSMFQSHLHLLSFQVGVVSAPCNVFQSLLSEFRDSIWDMLLSQVLAHDEVKCQHRSLTKCIPEGQVKVVEEKE